VTVSATETAVLAPNGTAEVRHTVHVAEPVDNSTTSTWMVNDAVAGNVSVLSTDDLESGVVAAYAEPTSVAPGERYDVVAVVHNPSDAQQGHMVTFGNGSAIRFVTLGAGETTLITHSATATQPGGTTAEWRVSGHSVTVDVTADS
jgi:hypothetical protein